MRCGTANDAGALQALCVRRDERADRLLRQCRQPHVARGRRTGSIIAAVNASGAASAIYSYDEYGVPAASNAGRFGYTGQVRLPEVVEAGLYYYKNRMYLSPLGRFPQPDLIGYAGGANLYAYVLNDPVNFVDPLGLRNDIVVTACAIGFIGFYAGAQTFCFLAGEFTGAGHGAPGDNRGRAERGGNGDRNQQKIPQCELQWLQKKLGDVGLPISNLSGVIFNKGLSLSANPITIGAYLRSGTEAVTQSNTVFVNPNNWAAYTTPGNAGRYEEIFHTRQFAAVGAVGFYGLYAGSSLDAKASGQDWYKGNGLEQTAKEAAEALANMFKREKPCPQ